MLQVKNVTIVQKKDGRVLVEDLSFVINDSEKVALIGEEGNGKSTLLKWLYDPQLVEPYAEVAGHCSTYDVLGYLPQELPIADREVSVCDYVARCAGTFLSPAALAKTAGQLGLSPALLHETRPMGSLSGGERVKVQLCTLLLCACDLLLLDEPSNDLDLDTLEWLERFLRHTDKTVLFVSHDETLLERTADAIIHIEQVRRKTIPRVTAARMPYRQYMDERERKMTHQAQVSRFEHDAFRKKKDRYLSIYQSVEYAQNTVSRADPGTARLLKKKMHTVKALERRLEKEREALTEQPEAEWAILPKFFDGVSVKNGKTVLDFVAKELAVGDRVLARDVRLFLTGPERVAIVGKNGCGKSTLLKRIAEALSNRTDLSVGYLPQNYDDLLDGDRTPVAFLAPNGDKERVTQARLYLGSMKYTTDEMLHPMRELSGGQRAKLLLLKLILDRNNVLLLDEPTRNFSPLSNPAVRQLLRSFGGAIIAVSHDRKFLEEVAEKIYRLDENGLTEQKGKTG